MSHKATPRGPATHADHHLHMRVRAGQRPNSFVDHLTLFAGPLIPLAVFFQVYEIWFKHHTAGISIITWGLLFFSSTVMATYAIYHRATPLMITYIPLVIGNGAVIAGVLLVR